MNPVSPKIAKERIDTEADKVCLVDVRSHDEFKSGHVPGATCMPLDQLEKNLALIPKDKLVILHCQAGKRSAQALKLLQARGFQNVVEMEGGFAAWSAAGLPVNRLRSTIPVIRQVLLTAGLLVFTGSALAFLVNPNFLFLPLIMGAGLTFAGATGWCGLAYLLEKMPWNQAASG